MRLLIFSTALLLGLTAQAQTAPYLEWQRCYGGTSNEGARDLLLLPDGGALITGTTNSNNGDVSGFQGGSSDIWVLRIDAVGNPVWQRCLGGSSSDSPRTCMSLPDGGFAIVGSTLSNDGDVSGHHGQSDGWVVKLSVNGTVEWQRCFGGSGGDNLYDARLLNNGDIIAVGASTSTDGDLPLNQGGEDAWAVRFDAQGNLQWSHTYGSSFGDVFYGMHINAANEVLAIGYAGANDGDVSGNQGGDDLWICNLDGMGTLQWQRCLGGSAYDVGFQVLGAADGGALVLGTTTSDDGDVVGYHGGFDAWVAKIDASGNLQWQRPLGGSSSDFLSGILAVDGGRFILTGRTASTDGDVSGSPVLEDCWMLEFDADGNLTWQLLLGGSGYDGCNCARRESDGALLLAGFSTSNDGDVSGNHGSSDTWLVRLAPVTAVQEHPLPSLISVYPIPATDVFFVRLPEGWVVPMDCALFDPSGRLVLRQTLRASELEHQIDIAGLTAGTYSVVLRGPHLLARGQVVKAH